MSAGLYVEKKLSEEFMSSFTTQFISIYIETLAAIMINKQCVQFVSILCDKQSCYYLTMTLYQPSAYILIASALCKLSRRSIVMRIALFFFFLSLYPLSYPSGYTILLRGNKRNRLETQYDMSVNEYT